METIGGYRIIRKLGTGECSDVYLGHAGAAAGRGGGLAALKVFRPGISETRINAEIGALSRFQHPHVVGLLDLATGPRDGACLVLQRLGPADLATLLAGRRMLQPGEVVTILAPVISAVAAMHRGGVSHGAISARKIHFDEVGAPVVAGFGAAACFAEASAELSDAALDSESLVLEDRSALVRLVKVVVARSEASDGSAEELIRWLERPNDGTVSLAELEHRVFALAEPLAVQFGDPLFPADGPDHSVPGRLFPLGGPSDRGSQQQRQEGGSPALPRAAGRAADILSVLPPDIAAWISGRLTATPLWFGSRTSVLRRQLRSVRKGVWLVATIGLIAVFAAMVIDGLSSTDDSAASEPEGSAPPPTVSEDIAGDDPVIAAAELLRLRAGCLDDLSILCLDHVHAADSAAWQADAAVIRSVQEGAELSPNTFPPGTTASLIDRLGQTALVELAPPADSPTRTTASVLMIRTEAGWRFRSLVADPAPVDDARS